MLGVLMLVFSDSLHYQHAQTAGWAKQANLREKREGERGSVGGAPRTPGPSNKVRRTGTTQPAGRPHALG